MTDTPTPRQNISQAVREHYGRIARSGSPGCHCGCPTETDTPASSACGPLEKALGYLNEDLNDAPKGANLGLGCGNPIALAELTPGETVLDLGSGAGFDCFLAAKRVGPNGRVIGVDMTADMVAKARLNATKAKVDNIDFRLGEIEHLPVADHSIDVILSNCVINLSPDKAAVFMEAFRVLRSGGRMAVADIVALRPLSDAIRSNLSLYTGCVAGALEIEPLRAIMADAGFEQIEITPQVRTNQQLADYFPDSGLEGHIASARLSARKP